MKDNKRLENDNEIFLRQISDLELFQKHLDEIEGLFRLPFGGTSNNKKKTSGDDDHTDLLDGADDEREKNKPLLDNMVLESGLPKDARFSNLPQIDITRFSFLLFLSLRVFLYFLLFFPCING